MGIECFEITVRQGKAPTEARDASAMEGSAVGKGNVSRGGCDDEDFAKRVEGAMVNKW